MSTAVRLIIFARLPILGKVKTRLEPLLGQQGCLALHLVLIEHSLNLASRWKHGPVELWWSEQPESEAQQDELMNLLDVPENLTVRFQQGENLGERMQYAMQSALDQGEHALVIGTDCPQQKIEHLERAVELIGSGLDVAVQPAFDGGFVLIACANRAPNLEGEIFWGSETVLSQLELELEKQQLSIGKIETISDLDNEKDFLLLQQDESHILSKFYLKKSALKIS